MYNTIEEAMNGTRYELESTGKKLDILYKKLLDRRKDFVEEQNGDIESFYLETELYFESMLYAIDSIGEKLRIIEELMEDYDNKNGIAIYKSSTMASLIEDYRKNEELEVIQKLLHEQRSNTIIHTEVKIQTNSFSIYADPFRIDCPEERFTFQKIYETGKDCVKKALEIVTR